MRSYGLDLRARRELSEDLLGVDPVCVRREGRVAEDSAQRLEFRDMGDHISGHLLAEARDECVVVDAEDLLEALRAG